MGAEEKVVQEQSVMAEPVQHAQPSDNSKHWIFVDVGRIIAVFLIVMMHVTSGAWGQSEVGTFNWYVLGAFNCLSRIGMPLFFMQVGAVFLNEKKELPIKSLYSQYILKIVTAFFFWSAFYMFTYYLFDAPEGFGAFTLPSFLTGLLNGAPYSQWFILLAISLYLLIPILKEIARNLTVCKYFLVLWVAFTILLPGMYGISGLIPQLPQAIGEGIIAVANSVSRIRPVMVIEYPGYMLLGHFLHRTQLSKKHTLMAVLLGVLAFGYTVGMTFHASLQMGSSVEQHFDTFSLNICLMAVAVTVGMKGILERVWLKKRTYKAVRFFSDVSFGIFLLHDFLRMGLVHLGVDAFTFTPLVFVPVLCLVVFILSGAVSYWLKNIPKIGPYIVGG